MKLRYERGALADLDEIFAYIAADSRQAAGRPCRSYRKSSKADRGFARYRGSNTEARLHAISGWQVFDRV
jgi:plasmid stabilization system protein ParE